MMEVDKVDHILRAAGEVTGRSRFVLIGSAAVFAWRQIVPEDMTATREVDLFACDVDPQEADRIAVELDGSLGQASQFDQSFGFYCDGVGPETAILPTDWEDRSIEYSNAKTGGVTAIVPHLNDIAISKLCAGREEDFDWLGAALAADIIDLEEMRRLFARLPAHRPIPNEESLEGRLRIVKTRAAKL